MTSPRGSRLISCFSTACSSTRPPLAVRVDVLLYFSFRSSNSFLFPPSLLFGCVCVSEAGLMFSVIHEMEAGVEVYEGVMRVNEDGDSRLMRTRISPLTGLRWAETRVSVTRVEQGRDRIVCTPLVAQQHRPCLVLFGETCSSRWTAYQNHPC